MTHIHLLLACGEALIDMLPRRSTLDEPAFGTDPTRQQENLQGSTTKAARSSKSTSRTQKQPLAEAGEWDGKPDKLKLLER